MQVHLYDPMALPQTALKLQSSVPKAHSSVSKRKYMWNFVRSLGQDGWILAIFFPTVIEQGTVKVHLQAEKERIQQQAF